MQFNTLTPMLWTADIQATMQFYTATLGFTTITYNEEWGWAHLQRGNCSIMFSRPNDHEPFDKLQCTGSFYFAVTGIDELWERLKNTPYVYYSLEDFAYGMREFAIKDNNGYILQFGEEIISH